MKILFVCKHNRFRSKVAEAIFNKLKSGSDECKSGGVAVDFIRQYVAENVKLVLEEKGYTVKDEKSRLINDYDIDWADKIVVVADNVSPGIFPAGKTIVWKIEDCDESEIEKIKKIINEIEKEVKELIDSIKE